jgi:hypothetical protein
MTSSSGPLAPRSGERARERGPHLIALASLAASLAACGGGTLPSGPGASTSFQSPDDHTGGYVIATVAAGMGTPRATIYDGSGNTELATFVAAAPGAPLSFWFTSAPGQTTRISLRDDAGAPNTYDLTTNYTQVQDAFEPNDAMDAATPMPPGAQMSAFLFAGRRDGPTDPAAWDDYFRFTAQPGALSVRVDDLPADLAAKLFLLRPDGTEVARVSNGMRGASLVMAAPTVTDAGDYVVRVSLWNEAPPPAGARTDDLPPSFIQPYLLTVSQPQPQP